MPAQRRQRGESRRLYDPTAKLEVEQTELCKTGRCLRANLSGASDLKFQPTTKNEMVNRERRPAGTHGASWESFGAVDRNRVVTTGH